MRQKHIVFALPGVGRLAYHLSTLQHLAESGHRITLVFCRRRLQVDESTPPHLIELQDYLDAFERKHANFDLLYAGKKDLNLRDPGSSAGKRHSTNNSVYLLRTYSSYLRRLPESNYYVQRWAGFLTDELRPWAERSWRRGVLRSWPAYRLLTLLERSGAPVPGIAAWLREVGADAVVASPTNTRNSVEADYLFAARRLGIPTAVPVMSWDNLTTKGLIPFDPTVVLAWNRHQEREAEEIHGIPPSRIVITGSPFFDKWFERRDLVEERATAAQRLGFDPQRPMLLYLGSSKNIAENESWLVRSLLSMLQLDGRLHQAQLVVRPHPGNPNMLADLKELPGITCLDSEIPITDRSTSALVNVVVHAAAVIGINTSGMVDALALDKPCFSVRTARYGDTHLAAAHFQHMVDADAIGVAEDLPALCSALGDVVEGRDDRREQRRRFIAEFLRPGGIDRPAGAIAAKAILLLAEGKRGPDISAAIETCNESWTSSSPSASDERARREAAYGWALGERAGV